MSTSGAEKGKGASEVVKVGFYHIIKTIGQGHSAVVKLANHTITKSDVAIKLIDKRLKDCNLEKIYREIKILKMIKHPNIIKLYQVMDSENFLYIVSEYAPNGEIFDYISNHGKFPEKEAKIKFAQILNAVEYCHDLGVVHRDLKAENLLLDENFNVKLADFGFGNFYCKDKMLSTWCGSPPYAAPEIFEGKTYCGPEVDIWSLGVILYVLVCGTLPFDGENLRAIRDQVVSGRFRIPFFMSIECEQLLRRILVVDSKRRYTIQQIKNHPWMKDAVIAVSNKSLEDSFMEKLVVTGRGISALYHEIVLRRMENANINKEKVIESLEKQSYDNFTAIYEILMEKVSQKIKQNLPLRLGAAGMRRPSVISEQAMITMQRQGIAVQLSVASPLSSGEAKPPGLAETREAIFSQTTDGVQLHEVAGPLCQMQQIISTSDMSAEDMARISTTSTSATLYPSTSGVLIMPSSPLRPKLIRSPRLVLRPGICWTKLPGSKGSVPNQLVGNSIDEGVEIEGEDILVISTVPSLLPTESVASTSPAFQAYCQPSISIDSNIEIDMDGSSWSVNSTSSNLPDFMPGTQAGPCEATGEHTADDPHFTQAHVLEEFTDFQMGRRASDGLAIKPEMAETYAQHSFPKNRACGMAELRKELVKLQNETMDSFQCPSQHQQMVQAMVACGGHRSRAALKDQRSLEESHMMKSSAGVRYSTNLSPNVCWFLQKRNPPYSRQSHLQSPLESHQGGLRADYSCLGTAHRPISPLRGCPKRQVGPMRSVPLHHHIQQNYPNVPGHQYLAEHLSSASNSPTRGGKLYSVFHGAHLCLAASSSPGDVNQISSSSQAPIANISSLGIPQNMVPVCHSQGNLVQNVLFGSPTRHKLEVPSNQQPSTSPTQTASSTLHPCATHAIIDPTHSHHCSGLEEKPHLEHMSNVQGDEMNPYLENSAVATEGHEKCHLMKRMIFSLVQQQQVCGSEEEMITSPGNSPDDGKSK